MVRYIRNDELYHYQVKGAKHGVRRYQYPDGTYTPLGRIHYGIGEYKNKTVGEKLLDTPRAIKNTLATYGYGKYKAKANPSGKYNSTERRFMKKADKARDERLKEKEKKKAENERKLKEQQEANIRANEERRKKYEDNQKKLQEEIAKEQKEIESKETEKKSQKNVDEAKQNRWSDFSNEDLQKYVDRVELEAKATEARLKKMDAPRQVIQEIVSYGDTAVKVFEQYKRLNDTVKSFQKKDVTPVQNTPTYADLIKANTFKDLIMVNGIDANAKKFNGDQLDKWIDIIEKINKLEPKK